MERTDTGHAKADQIRRARDVTTMFDELRTMADRARLEADLDRLTTELEQARRSWWLGRWVPMTAHRPRLEVFARRC